MFLHIYKNSIKVLFKNKTLLFWTFLFPIILATLFNMAFSDIENKESLEIIDIGIVDNDNFNHNLIYLNSFKYLGSSENENRLFNITYSDNDNLRELLDKEEIVGYLYLDEKPHIIIKRNGIYESIFKYVVEEIEMTSNGLDTIEFNSLDDINNYSKKIMNTSVLKKDLTNKNISYTMIEFYSLIAMTCLYGAILSMYLLNQTLPDMSNKGKRVSVSPVSKFKLIVSNLFASFTSQVIGVMILFVYTLFILNIDYGSNIFLVILLALVGSFAGLSLGIFISSIIKGNENKKIGIIISITMIYSFLSGMMGITMKYVIDKNIPIINKINPVNMITDGLYSLYYYDTLDRYIFNIISLLIYSSILIMISCFFLRRNKYDSI